MITLRRTVAAAILAFSLVGALANVAQAAAALDHACCHRAPAESSAAPEVPCDGFIPLTCCRAAALPGTEHVTVTAPASVALHSFIALTAPTRVAATPPALAVLAPRIAATRLSVVLLV